MTNFALKTRDQIRDAIADDLRNTISGARVEGPGDDLFDLAAGVAPAIEEAQRGGAYAVAEAFPQTASFAGLKKHFGPLIGDPRAATPAKIEITVTGTIGSPYTTADVLVAAETGIRYSPSTDGALLATSEEIWVEALTGGDNTVLAEDAVLVWETTLAGIDPVAVATGEHDGGADAETQEEYLARGLEALGNPQAGGKAADFERWCLGVDGVGKATAFVARRGLGTIDVAVLDPEGDAVSDLVLAAAQDAIDDNRPACAKGSQAVRPVLVEVDLTFELYLEAGFEFSAVTSTAILSGSTSTSVVVADVSQYTVGDWVAWRQNRQARQIVSIDTGTSRLGLNSAFTDRFGARLDPDVGDDLDAGCPTYDQLAASIADYFDGLRSGATYYSAKAKAALLANAEALNCEQTSPAGDVAALVDPDLIQHLVLGELTLESA